MASAMQIISKRHFTDRSIAGVAVMRGPGHPAGKVGGDPLASAKAWIAATDRHND